MEINLTIVGQIITFAIFIWFTVKFVWPPLKKAMDERKNKIDLGLVFAKKATDELELAKKEAHVILKDARAEAVKIIERAQMEAIRIDEDAKHEARSNAKRIIDAANIMVHEQVEKAKAELQKEVVGLVILGVEKITTQKVGREIDEQFLEELTRKL